MGVGIGVGVRKSGSDSSIWTVCIGGSNGRGGGEVEWEVSEERRIGVLEREIPAHF